MYAIQRSLYSSIMELSEDGSSIFEYYLDFITDLSINKPDSELSDNILDDDEYLNSGALSTVRLS